MYIHSCMSMYVCMYVFVMDDGLEWNVPVYLLQNHKEPGLTDGAGCVVGMECSLVSISLSPNHKEPGLLGEGIMTTNGVRHVQFAPYDLYLKKCVSFTKSLSLTSSVTKSPTLWLHAPD